MDILLASGNEHKKKELEALLYPHRLHLPSEFGETFECDETGTTFEENALQKAAALKELSAKINMPVLADDSGLLVDALPGQLGIHTARYGSKEGEPVLPAVVKNRLLIEAMKDIPSEKRGAHFVCVLVLVLNDCKPIICRGEAMGHILTEPVNGSEGFGYDPVFYCNEAGMSMALLPPGGKNLYSHRGKAAHMLLEQINKLK